MPQILIIDSDSSSIKHLQDCLLSSGYEIITTSDSENALEIIAKQNINLVLLGLAGMGIEALETCKQIKSQDSSKDIPVIMIASPEDMQTRLWSFQSHIDDYISTPINKPELEMRVKSLIRIKQLEETRVLAAFYKSMINLQVNTSVTAIKNHLDLVMENPELQDDLKANISSAREYTDELFTFISDFVSLEKIEEGSFKPHFENTDINVMIERSIEQLRFAAKKLAISLNNTSNSQTLFFEIDRSLTLRVIINLIINAIKFTTHGGDIGIGAKSANNELSVYVEYTGKGIPLEHRESIFNKFSRDDVPVINLKSAGWLGLAFSKCAIESLGGRIWYESQGNDKGGKFSFTIPHRQAAF